MFVFVLAVPALLIVLLGYVVGYEVWAQFAGSPGAGAEVAGWVTGALTLAGVVGTVVAHRRSRRREER